MDVRQRRRLSSGVVASSGGTAVSAPTPPLAMIMSQVTMTKAEVKVGIPTGESATATAAQTPMPLS